MPTGLARWLPKPGVEREFFTSKVGDNLYTAGVVVPVGATTGTVSKTQAHVPRFAPPGHRLTQRHSRADGRWQIVSHLISDARSTETGRQ